MRRLSHVYHAFRKSESSESVALSDGRLSLQRIADVLDTVIPWFALGLIPLVAIAHGADKIWWQAAFECGAFGLGALWIANGFLTGSWPLREAKFFVPLLILAAYAFFQTLPLVPESSGAMLSAHGRQTVSADPAGTYHFVAELLALIILGKLLLDYTRDRRRLFWLVYVVIGVGSGSAVFGMIRLMAQNTSPDLVIFGQVQGQGFAQFANQNHFALMLEMSLGLGLGLVLGPGLNRQRLLLHVGIVLLLASTIVFTTSRGGVLAMVGQMLFLAVWLAVRRVWRDKSSMTKKKGLLAWQNIGKLALSMVLISGLVIVVVIGIVSVGGEKLASRMEELPGEWGNQEDNTHAQRGDVWRATWRLIEAHPISGTGFGAYETAIPEYHDASGEHSPSSALNEYLNLLAGGGAIGAGLAIWFMIVLTLRIRKSLKSNIRFERAASLGGVAGLFGVATHSLVDSGLQVPINAVMFFALMVIVSSNVGAKDGTLRSQREG
jgi:O-antigen ligase